MQGSLVYRNLVKYMQREVFRVPFPCAEKTFFSLVSTLSLYHVLNLSTPQAGKEAQHGGHPGMPTIQQGARGGRSRAGMPRR